MTGTLDPRLVAALEQLVARATPGRPLLVASDFDGVLAPLGDDPSASRPTPAATVALDRLAAAPGSRIRLALVSGRTLESLGALAQAPPGTLLIGSHGAERGEVVPAAPGDVHGDVPGDTSGDAPRVERRPFALSAAEAALLDQVRAGLEGIAVGVEGAWVEHKPSAAVLHTRLAAAVDGARAADAADELGLAVGGHTMRGKDVVEVAVVATSKGQALTALRRDLGAAAVFYMGDDVTDERAFEVLGPDDLTVKVGAGDTAARFRVPGPDAAAEVLATLADALLPPGAPASGPLSHD